MVSHRPVNGTGTLIHTCGYYKVQIHLMTQYCLHFLLLDLQLLAGLDQ